MKKAKKWIKWVIIAYIILFVLWLVYSLLGITWFGEDTDDWYHADLEAITRNYAKTIDSEGEILIKRYVYVGYDKTIEERNEGRANCDKEYPFFEAKAYVKIGRQNYVFYIVKDEFGALYVSHHEITNGGMSNS